MAGAPAPYRLPSLVTTSLSLPPGPRMPGLLGGAWVAGVLGDSAAAASPARGGFAGTQGLRRPTRSWETRRASRSPSSISVCCRMWRLHSPWAGNASGRSAGGGVSLGHDPTAVGMGTDQVRDYSQRNPAPPPPTSSAKQTHRPRPLCPHPARPPNPAPGRGLLAPSSHLLHAQNSKKSILMDTHPASVRQDSPQTGWHCPPPGWAGMGVHRTQSLVEAAGVPSDFALQPVDAPKGKMRT